MSFVADYISGDANRVFVNPVLGCDSNCSYCYLGSQDLIIGKKTSPPKEAKSLLTMLLNFDRFNPGRNGSIIGIGCYSECWSRSNLEVTREFIKLALKLKNPIQFATKRAVSVDQLQEISLCMEWKGQLSLFVSCATISNWQLYEKGTARPANRFKEMAGIKNKGINVCLYIKPVLDSVTLHDALKFCSVIEEQNCSVIVGERFFYAENNVGGMVKAPIPSKGLYVEHVNDKDVLLELFKARGYTCFESSIDAVNYWRLNSE